MLSLTTASTVLNSGRMLAPLCSKKTSLVRLAVRSKSSTTRVPQVRFFINNPVSVLSQSSPDYNVTSMRNRRQLLQKKFTTDATNTSNTSSTDTKAVSADDGAANNNGLDDASDDTNAEIKIPGAEKGGRKLAIVFTCTADGCNTRSVKQFTERAYNHGVVIATCPGCQNKHLIADNLGFFSDKDEEGGWNIQKAMERMGENVKVASNDDVLELSVEDLFTKEAIDGAINEASKEESLPPDSTKP